MLMMALPPAEHLIHLSAVDILIIAIYFAIVLFIGWSLAVIDATERRTRRALSKPSSSPMPKNTPTIR